MGVTRQGNKEERPALRCKDGWEEVERLAVPADECLCASTVIEAAYQSISECESSTFHSLETDETPLGVHSVSPGDLPDCANDAVDALVAWHLEGGGLAVFPCSGPSPWETKNLALATLAAAEHDPASPRIVALLHLSRDLRRCGGIFEAMSGFTMARRITVWASDRDLGPTEAFESYRPTRDEAISSVARHALCAYRSDAFSGVPASRLVSSLGWTEEVPSYVSLTLNAQRELFMLRYYYGKRIVSLAEHPEELQEHAFLLDRPPAGELPASYLVHVTTSRPYMGNVVRAMDHHVENYDAYLEGRPSIEWKGTDLVISEATVSSMRDNGDSSPDPFSSVLQIFAR